MVLSGVPCGADGLDRRSTSRPVLIAACVVDFGFWSFHLWYSYIYIITSLTMLQETIAELLMNEQ